MQISGDVLAGRRLVPWPRTAVLTALLLKPLKPDTCMPPMWTGTCGL